MSKILKWLLLLTIFVLSVNILTGCDFSRAMKDSDTAPIQSADHPLQPTLSSLETAVAHQQPPVPIQQETVSPDVGRPSVPQTGSGESQVQETPTPLPALDPLSGLPILVPEDILQPQLSPTLACPTHDAVVEISAPKTTLKVGETVAIKVTLENTGCVSLGLPQYRLAILNSEVRPIFSPDKLEPIIHSISVNPGKSDEATFTLQSASPGKATLTALASFEVHLGYPGPAYWGAASSKALVIQVFE